MAQLLIALTLFGTSKPGVGVIVVEPPQDLDETQWAILRDLAATPEVLLYPEASSPAHPFDFGAFEALLVEYAERGIRVAVTLTPHMRSTPWQPVVGPDGTSRADRQNPFDPAFRAEWARLHSEFCARYGSDERIGRVYVAPPSYFGEVEYYMGPDWSSPELLCYDPLARERFGEWLSAHYGVSHAEVQGLGAHFVPTPADGLVSLRVDTAWLDLMEWRTDYLAAMVAGEVDRITASSQFQVGVKYSVGDCCAYQGTDSARCFLSITEPDRVVLHLTNAHSLLDLRLAHATARQIGAAGVCTENDGNRLTRDELARICLNLLLSGTPELNFAHLGHLTSAEVIGSRPTETVRALAEVARYAQEAALPPPSPVVMLHSVATAWVRPPSYRNRDVSHVYDPALANCGARDAWGYNWARFLGLPDVLSEALVEAGALRGRRLAVLPSTGPTLLTAAARDELLAWVADGGTLVAFGRDSLAWTLEPPRGASRVRREAEAALPDTRLDCGPLTPVGSMRGLLTEHPQAVPTNCPAPVWSGFPGRPWRPLLRGRAGAVAIAERPLGLGRVVLFAGPVPAETGGECDEFYAQAAPAILRYLAREAGVEFACELFDPAGNPSAALALSYLGRDQLRGVHRFVGGAYDGSAGRVILRTSPRLKGPAELLLVDTRDAAARGTRSEGVTVVRSAPTQSELYEDPTNVAARAGVAIPWVRVTFDLPGEVELTLGPT